MRKKLEGMRFLLLVAGVLQQAENWLTTRQLAERFSLSVGGSTPCLRTFQRYLEMMTDVGLVERKSDNIRHFYRWVDWLPPIVE